MNDSSKIIDGLLVLQYRSGRPKAFDILVRKYHARLCKHSYWYTHDVEASKDIVQDSWRLIMNKLDGLKEPNRFGSWAHRIVTRKSLDYVNRRKRERQRVKEWQLIAPHLEDKDEKEVTLHKLLTAIRSLPPSHQQAIRLFYTEGYSLKEIADIVRVSTGTVKSRLFHAREKLKLILKK